MAFGLPRHISRERGLSDEPREAQRLGGHSCQVECVIFKKDDKMISLKGRGCREHLDLLIKKYKEEDKKALKWYVAVALP